MIGPCSVLLDIDKKLRNNNNTAPIKSLTKGNRKLAQTSSKKRKKKKVLSNKLNPKKCIVGYNCLVTIPNLSSLSS